MRLLPISTRSGLTRDPHSKSGRSVRVIGYSHSRNKILTVILVHREDGGYWGANGWESSSSDRRRYERGE
jgi:hypothetical protein